MILYKSRRNCNLCLSIIYEVFVWLDNASYSSDSPIKILSLRVRYIFRFVVFINLFYIAHTGYSVILSVIFNLDHGRRFNAGTRSIIIDVYEYEIRIQCKRLT